MGNTIEFAEARARGMKLVVVDPVLTYAASQADEWVPLRPGTDGAFALALANVILNELDICDAGYLKAWTNATYLVGPDGHYVRDAETGKPLVWNEVTGQAGPFDQVDPEQTALEGKFEAAGTTATTGFTLYREHLRSFTPEWASEITTIPVETIRRLAGEFSRAARIGATIQLDGHTLPLRPAGACFYRGVSAHRHAMHGSMAIAQLNLLVGSVDVPGGMVNGTSANPLFFPEMGEDGLIIPAAGWGHVHPPLPQRPVREPDTLEMVELFPLAFFSGTMMWLALADPELAERFGLSHSCEVFIHARSNVVAMGADPEVMSAAIRRIPFQVSFATYHDETTNFADIVLPETQGLERLGGLTYDSLTANAYVSAVAPGESWAFNVQQPVVEPAGETRSWIEVLVDLAGRLGVTEELNRSFNAYARLEGPNRLEPDRAYTWPEMLDRQLKSLIDDEHGLDYFKEHGYYSTGVQRAVEHSYTRPFHSARIPLYLEHFIRAGENVRAYMDARGVDWDTSDYVPLMDWKPCQPFEAPAEFDLWAVNQKLPFMSFSWSEQNPWITELAEHNAKVYPIGMSPQAAKRRGIGDGDAIWIETQHGHRIPAVARLTEGVHPECIVVPGVVGRDMGTLPRTRGKGVHYNRLVRYTLEDVDPVTGAVDSCAKVKVSRAVAGRVH
jgi:molybdopterin-containing oxidoreductase family molybdopterin binding subunit